MNAVPSSDLIHDTPTMFGPQGNVQAALSKLDRDPLVKKMRGLMLEVLNGIEELRFHAPQWKWDNPVGDIGEYVAATLLGMTFAGSGQKGFDVTANGRTIQIKTMFKGDVPGFRGACDDFMMFRVDAAGLPTVAYYGTYEEVHALSKYSKADNKRTITLAKVQDMLGKSSEEIQARVNGYNRIIEERQAEIAPVIQALQRVFAARAQMKELTDKIQEAYSWTNPVGDFGEFLAVRMGMVKADVGNAGYDGVINGLKTQVKTSLHGTSIGLRKSSQDADTLLALGLVPHYKEPAESGRPREVLKLEVQVNYAGPISWVLARMGALNAQRDAGNWDNKWSLGLNTLEGLGYIHNAMHTLRDVPHLVGGLVDRLHGMLDHGQRSRQDARESMDGLLRLARVSIDEHNFGIDEALMLTSTIEPSSSSPARPARTRDQR